MPGFDFKTRKAIGSYVYCLVDPRTKKTFYIGKGEGNRVFQHAQDALKSPHETDRIKIIREIKKSGQEVQCLIIKHGMDKKTALAVESSLIDFTTHFKLNLSNQVLGHHTYESGIMTTEEVKRKYGAKRLKSLGKIEGKCVIININKTYTRGGDYKSIYNATKKSWVIRKDRINMIEYVLSVYDGCIVEVFEVNKWYETQDLNGNIRWGFDGKQAPDNLRRIYLNHSIVRKKGSRNPISYNL